MSAPNDWTPVVLKKNLTAKPKSEHALAQAKAKGQVETVHKPISTTGSTVISAQKLDDNEADDYKHVHVTHEFKIALMKARQAKGLSQKDLAAKLNIKPAVIADYESGKAIPVGGFIATLNRTLDTKLPPIPKKKKVADEQ